LKDKATALPRGVTSRTVTSQTGARTTDEGLTAAGRLAGQTSTVYNDRNCQALSLLASYCLQQKQLQQQQVRSV